jgi:hypothetical protein
LKRVVYRVENHLSDLSTNTGKISRTCPHLSYIDEYDKLIEEKKLKKDQKYQNLLHFVDKQNEKIFQRLSTQQQTSKSNSSKNLRFRKMFQDHESAEKIESLMNKDKIFTKRFKQLEIVKRGNRPPYYDEDDHGYYFKIQMPKGAIRQRQKELREIDITYRPSRINPYKEKQLELNKKVSFFVNEIFELTDEKEFH